MPEVATFRPISKIYSFQVSMCMKVCIRSLFEFRQLSDLADCTKCLSSTKSLPSAKSLLCAKSLPTTKSLAFAIFLVKDKPLIDSGVLVPNHYLKIILEHSTPDFSTN